MTESQMILLQLVKELDEICKANNIRYYFVGGSALGAVRHHGFIPWDDDADIVMDYWSYMKFLSVMREIKLPQNRSYSDAFLSPYSHTNIFGRYSATDTTQIFDGIAFQEDNSGIKVDVFMLIPCPDEGPERDSFMKRFHCWAELAHPTARSKEADPEDYLHYAMIERREGFYPLRETLFKELECDKYKDSSQYLYGYERVAVFYDKDIFEEPLYFPFEDMTAPVPTQYQKHFRAIFGDDWMFIPTQEEEITHVVLEDTKHPHTLYKKDYMRFKSPDDFELRQDYKYKVMNYWQCQKNLNKAHGALKSKFLTRKYEFFWQRNSNEIERLYAKGDYQSVLTMLDEYLIDQTGPLAQASYYFLEVPPRMVFIATASALFSSKTKLGRRLLSYIPESYPGDDINSLRELLAAQDEIVLLFDDDSTSRSEIESCVDCYLKRFPESRTLSLWKAMLLLENLTSCNEENQRVEIQELLSAFEDDGEFLKLRGDLALREGDMSAARTFYERAVLRTDNGLVLLAIEKIPDMNIRRPKVIFHG